VFPPTQALVYRRREMIRTYGENMAAKLMTKSELIQKIAEKHGESVTRKDVKGVIESLAEIGYRELKKTGAFVVPGFAKFVVTYRKVIKAATASAPWSNGQTEGQICKLKLVKRQMYGRGKLDLLEARVVGLS
jgi:DNA-binding protein HU-beta